jgi:hypothetical protein
MDQKKLSLKLPRGSKCLFLLLALGLIPFGILYCTLSEDSDARFQKWRENRRQEVQPVKSIKSTDQFILTKDEKLELNKIGIEYNGVQNKNFLFKLYLLDFDRQQSFPMQVPKKDIRESITFGGTQFTILSGNDRTIKLKLIESYETP